MRTSKKSFNGFLLAKHVVEVQEFGILENLGTFKDVLHWEVLCCCSTIGTTVTWSKDTRIEKSIARKIICWFRGRFGIERLDVRSKDTSA